MTVPVAEVFGPTWQGEGPHAGRRCSFLRLGLCNLACVWCDTPYTWDRARYDIDAECPPRDAGWVLDALDGHDTDLLVVTGGEPLIHATNPTLFDIIDNWDGDIDVETNGTLPPPPWADMVWQFAVSPKLWTGGPRGKRLRPAVLDQWAETANAYFKIVCSTPEQVDEVAQYQWFTPHRTWIMPEGTSTGTLLSCARRIEQAVLDNGYHLTLRQQTFLHGDDRGY